MYLKRKYINLFFLTDDILQDFIVTSISELRQHFRKLIIEIVN